MNSDLAPGQIIYVFGGLSLADAPHTIYKALLFAPALVVWKTALYVRVLLGLDQSGWVRTARNGGHHDVE